MKMTNSLLTSAIVAAVASISGCGGGGGGAAAIVTAPLTGIFVDSAVVGIHYRTESLSGITGPNGEYQYKPGETVIFSIGDIDLPAAPASGVVTPLTLAGTTDLNNTSVVNIARLLQSLDDDGNPINGITITETAHTTASGMSVDFASATFDADVDGLMTGLSITLVTPELAVAHMQDTLVNELTTAQLMSGTRWVVEYDDGLRDDGTTDMHCEEVSSLQTITVGTDGSWNVAGIDSMTGPFVITFPAATVTVDEVAHTATLMDADGLGRTILTYDVATNGMTAQWQKFYIDTWLANYETWSYIAPSVATIMAGTWDDVQHDDGLRADGTTDDHLSEINAPVTITINLDGSLTYAGTDAGGPFSVNFPAEAIAVDEANYSVTLMDADGLGRTIMTYNPVNLVIHGQWQKFYNGSWLENYETWTESHYNTCS